MCHINTFISYKGVELAPLLKLNFKSWRNTSKGVTLTPVILVKKLD